ncbi:uncharacterized protein LOC121869844 isoform X2 [Homarus americanus]|uniref:uncharacterized protein LOC121869844 isoform X2 n=1 Tax=Homarus americanus TaxID=6706 RepID=UPI001C43B133|nr:uncharacterized protein LOC121869844 isoform X2 [Homarus americanus]
MVLRGVLVVVLLVLRLGPSYGTPLMEENESVAHHLSPEVVQQLLAVTNNTLHHVQDVKSLLTPIQEHQASVEVSGSAGGVLRRDISMQILLLLLETEQVRHSRVLEQVSQQMRGVGGRDTATSGEQWSAAINTVLLPLLQLQQEVRQLATRHPSFSTGDNTASQPQQSPSQPLQPQLPITGDNSCNTPTNRCRRRACRCGVSWKVRKEGGPWYWPAAHWTNRSTSTEAGETTVKASVTQTQITGLVSAVAC